MEILVELITKNSISVVCVAYLIYFQATTMKSMLKTLEGINKRLGKIEKKVGIDSDDTEE